MYKQTGLIQSLLHSLCICCAAIVHSVLYGSCHLPTSWDLSRLQAETYTELDSFLIKVEMNTVPCPVNQFI